MRTIKHTMPLRADQPAALNFSADAVTVFNFGGWAALRSYIDQIPVGVYRCIGNGANCPCFGTGYLEVTDDE